MLVTVGLGIAGAGAVALSFECLGVALLLWGVAIALIRSA